MSIPLDLAPKPVAVVKITQALSLFGWPGLQEVDGLLLPPVICLQAI